MKKILSILSIILTFSVISSCVSKLPSYSITSILPRDSFVKVEVNVKIIKCLEAEAQETDSDEHCITNEMLGHGSGAILESRKKGSYILTAGHVCEEKELEEFATENDLDYSMRLEIVNLNGEKYDAKIVKIDRDIDTCILFSPDLEGPEIKLRRHSKPEPGEKVYNIAAPAAIFEKNMVPILEGRYSGDLPEGGYSVYTIPAVGGSSGSPIINKKGELVGMIHSVHIRFPHVTFSPTTKALYDFIWSVL